MKWQEDAGIRLSKQQKNGRSKICLYHETGKRVFHLRNPVPWFKIGGRRIEQFIESPYNRFADIKMLKFFTQISTTALLVLIGLLILSLLIQNSWCRYLCPYGALIGLLGIVSIGKIHRHPSHCTECGKCETNCPGRISIRQKTAVNSMECSACLTCIETCPEKKAVKFSFFSGKVPITGPLLALFFLLMFTSGITIAKLSGNWQNEISAQEYLHYATSPGHTVNAIDQIEPEKLEHMRLMMQELKEQRIRMQELQKNKGD